MQNDIAQWVSIGISLILAVIGPLLTQILINKFQYKLQKTNAKREDSLKTKKVYEEFLEKVGFAWNDGKLKDLNEGIGCIYKIYLYCPKEWHQDIDKLLENKYNPKEATIILQKIAKLMAEEIQK